MYHSASMQGSWGSRSLAEGMAGGLMGIQGIQSKKDTMQCLNGCLASYLERIRSLEAGNWRTKSKIQKYLEKEGPQDGDWKLYFKTIEHLGSDLCKFNARIVMQSGNACLATDNSRVKYEM